MSGGDWLAYHSKSTGNALMVVIEREREQLVIGRAEGWPEAAVAGAPVDGVSNDRRSCNDRTARDEGPDDLSGLCIQGEHRRVGGIEVHRGGKYDPVGDACRPESHAALSDVRNGRRAGAGSSGLPQ